MQILRDDRLVGLGRDDGEQYVWWIRSRIDEIGAHIPYYANSNTAALQKLEELALLDAPLDFVTTDIVNVYSQNYHEGIDFVRAIRTMPDHVRISGGLRLKYIPVLVFTGGGFTRSNIDAIHQIDSKIPVVNKTDGQDLPRALLEMVSRYRHDVLAELQRSGYAVVWEGGRFRLVTAYEMPDSLDSQYFAGRTDRVTQAYARLVLVTGAPSIAQRAIEEFEHLLNSKGTAERDLQSFFERHPEFLMGDEYDGYWAEPQLTSPATGQTVRPDFVLQPLALRMNTWQWTVVDLKRHDVDVLIAKRFHVDLSRHVYRAATQLRDYAEFFSDPRNSQVIRQRFGGVVPMPRLTMVIGRLPNSDRPAFARLQHRVSGVHIRTYDDVLEFRRARLDRLRQLGA